MSDGLGGSTQREQYPTMVDNVGAIIPRHFRRFSLLVCQWIRWLLVLWNPFHALLSKHFPIRNGGLESLPDCVNVHCVSLSDLNGLTG